ncbi:hypothetical protein C8Q77DRAFT_343164 [Trametes polyzona]|nr:hypothetical protein C8Q77DRAFT_343164 [Trametes polyzona]
MQRSHRLRAVVLVAMSIHCIAVFSNDLEVPGTLAASTSCYARGPLSTSTRRPMPASHPQQRSSRVMMYTKQYNSTHRASLFPQALHEEDANPHILAGSHSLHG